ncbi:hypothetical protein [Winogradskyella sp.]|uniref:hypothetical protein n=1 Tax=Winogradskyella sp. TaxID=1883156 RepID=UPI0026196B4C|nr:hypothetical protein [Winogradskyella sp.]
MILKPERILKIGIFFLLVFLISHGLLWLFEERFDKTRWASDPLHRYEMVDDLIESQLLMQKPKPEVIAILGEPSSSSNTEKDMFIYKIGDPPSFFNSRKEHLLIIFVNQKVDEVTLAFE